MNRRQSRAIRSVQAASIRLWKIRKVLLLTAPYLLFMGWLFAGDSLGEVRVGEFYGAREVPEWSAPDGEHWFGTTANGSDLFTLSRRAMATSVSLAVVAVSLGIALSLLAVMLFAFDERRERFEWPERFVRAGAVIPSMVFLVILAGGSGGSLLATLLGLVLIIAFHLFPLICRWFREGEEDFDLVAVRILGISQREIVIGRVLPRVWRRLPGVFALLVPVVLLTEMGLSFLGFTGDRLSVGMMIAHGQAYLVEAPWMTICPGIFASIVVMVLSFLGWRVSRVLATGPLPHIF